MGNRTSVTKGSTTTSYEYDKANQLITAGSLKPTHDANGNMTNDGRNTYAYNAENQITSVQNSSGTTIALYEYNHEGKRTKKVSGGKTELHHYNARDLPFITDGANKLRYSNTRHIARIPPIRTARVRECSYDVIPGGKVAKNTLKAVIGAKTTGNVTQSATKMKIKLLIGILIISLLVGCGTTEMQFSDLVKDDIEKITLRHAGSGILYSSTDKELINEFLGVLTSAKYSETKAFGISGDKQLSDFYKKF